MAPEVIEQSGATTSSDIWSVGCTVIELLEGKPPYHFLDPMPALFRIVQDDCPPIPEGASPIVKDFLYHCFQKDCNLRISAKKLLRHPWMVSARKQLESQHAQRGTSGPDRPLSNYNFDEAVLKVQEWNEALKCMCMLTRTFKTFIDRVCSSLKTNTRAYTAAYSQRRDALARAAAVRPRKTRERAFPCDTGTAASVAGTGAPGAVEHTSCEGAGRTSHGHSHDTRNAAYAVHFAAA